MTYNPNNILTQSKDTFKGTFKDTFPESNAKHLLGSVKSKGTATVQFLCFFSVKVLIARNSIIASNLL